MIARVWFSCTVLSGLFLIDLSFAVEEPFCGVVDIDNRPPRPCVDDVLSIRFPTTGTSELTGVRVGDEFEVVVLLDINTPPMIGVENCPQPPPFDVNNCGAAGPLPPITECSKLYGLSYGVSHDTSFLEITDVTTEKSEDLIRNAEYNVADFAGKLRDEGFFSQVLITIDTCPPLDFPPLVKDFKLASARYQVVALPPVMGTKIEFVASIQPGPHSTTLFLGLTYLGVLGGESKEPRLVNNAVVKGAPRDSFFTRGDYNGDGLFDITDPIASLNFIFFGVPVDCQDAVDFDDNGEINLADTVALLIYLYNGNAAPQEPFPFCGTDPRVDNDPLNCVSFSLCADA